MLGVITEFGFEAEICSTNVFNIEFCMRVSTYSAMGFYAYSGMLLFKDIFVFIPCVFSEIVISECLLRLRDRRLALLFT